MVTPWLVDNLLAFLIHSFLRLFFYYFVSISVFDDFNFRSLVVRCVCVRWALLLHALHSVASTHIVFGNSVVFRWSFVCFVHVYVSCCAHLRKVLSKYLLFLNSPYVELAIDSQSHTSASLRHSLIPERTVNRHGKKYIPKINAAVIGQWTTNAFERAKGFIRWLWEKKNTEKSKSSRDKFGIQRPFANYDGLFIAVTVIYNFNWPVQTAPQRTQCSKWLGQRAPVASENRSRINSSRILLAEHRSVYERIGWCGWKKRKKELKWKVNTIKINCMTFVFGQVCDRCRAFGTQFFFLYFSRSVGRCLHEKLMTTDGNCVTDGCGGKYSRHVKPQNTHIGRTLGNGRLDGRARVCVCGALDWRWNKSGDA